MKQYDVVANPFRRRAPDIPLLLVLQHERNSDSANVIVAPLSIRAKASRREVALLVRQRTYVMLPMEITSLARNSVASPPIANLINDSFRIQTALDMVFSAAG